MSIIINRNIIFLDSLQFCKESLDKLASNLNNEDFKHLVTEFPTDKLQILKRKDSYPYEWVDSYEKFHHQELPPKKGFYSSIDDGKRGEDDGNISDELYLHLKNVWNDFNFNTFRDYHNHYLKKDVLLLADVFEKFISTSLKYYNLNPCHYFIAPGLSRDAMLKITKIELEKISNPDIHLFIEKGMKGGISYVSKKYSKASKYCPDYDKNKPEKHIAYIDMNLYGKAMSEYLPYGGFKWIKDNNQIINKIINKRDDSLHGYFLEVHLDYPENLHDSHKDYSMAPAKIKIKDELLSLYCLEIENKNDIKTGDINKLVPNLMLEKNYVLHYRNLKYYFSQGLILKKVLIILEFIQSAWMKLYIDFNTQKRKEATNEADKNQFKLLNNAVYGKTMENMRKIIKIRIIENEKDLTKHIARLTYINYDYYGKRLIVIHEKKEQLTLNKRIYVGNAVLELSKLEMYKFNYNFMKNEVGIFTLLYAETDSFIYEIIGEEFYERIYKYKELFDLSNFPKDSKYFCNDNKKVPGKMKDEYGGTSIYEFIGLKSKMCSMRDITKK